VVGAGCCVIAYLLARRVCSREFALLAAGLTMTAGVAYRFLVLHNWYSTLLACLAVYAAVRLAESQRTAWPSAFAVGSLVSLTALVEQSKGAGLCLGLVVGYLILRVFAGKNLLHRPRFTLFSIGFSWPWVVTFLFFSASHALGAMLHGWLWPLHHYATANHVLYGYQNWSTEAREALLYTGPTWLRIAKFLTVSPGFVVPVLPLAAVALLAYWTVRFWKKTSVSRDGEYYTIVSAALSGLLISVLMVRADITHLMDLIPLWYVVLAWILGAREARSWLLPKLRPYVTASLCFTFGLLSFALLLTANGARNQVQTRRGIVLTQKKDTVIEYVQAHLAPGDELLVYPYLPLYNYLTETHSPARVDFFQAGMNTAEQADEIVTILRSRKNRAVLFEPGFADKFAASWPGTPLGAIANDPVADFIIHNYRVCSALTAASGWRFQFMVRKEEYCR
jgi:hypothetical protein